jgi:hypothetical protein
MKRRYSLPRRVTNTADLANFKISQILLAQNVNINQETIGFVLRLFDLRLNLGGDFLL